MITRFARPSPLGATKAYNAPAPLAQGEPMRRGAFQDDKDAS